MGEMMVVMSRATVPKVDSAIVGHRWPLHTGATVLLWARAGEKSRVRKGDGARLGNGGYWWLVHSLTRTARGCCSV